MRLSSRRIHFRVLFILGCLCIMAASACATVATPTHVPNIPQSVASPTSASEIPVPAVGGVGSGIGVAPEKPMNKDVVPVINFSLSNSNHTTPRDVLRELGFLATGGGGGGFCYRDTPETSTFFFSQMEQVQDMSIRSCGWQPDESVMLTVFLPDGTTEMRILPTVYYPARSVYYAGFTFSPKLKDPIGVYTFQIASFRHTVQGRTKVIRPIGGRTKMTDSGLLIYNFLPNEHVRLFAYRIGQTCTLEGWIELAAGPTGQSLVLLDSSLREFSFHAIGETSGEVGGHPCSQALIRAQGSEPVSVVCANAPEPRLSWGRRARVTFTNGIGVRVRTGPGIRYDMVALLSEGSEMWVADNPVCAEGYIWWKVNAGNDLVGWVAEGELGNYFIEPWQ